MTHTDASSPPSTPADRKLNDWLDSFIELTKNSEPPFCFRLWVGISTIAAVLERRNWLVWEGNLYPNLYVILVSPAGRARKGTAMRYGRMFLEDIGIKLTAEAVTRESLIRRLAKSRISYFKAGDKVPSWHSSLTIYSEELAVFLNHNDTRMIRDLTDWFDCKDRWTYETKDVKLTDRITNLFVNMCGATTPDILGHIMPRETIAGGLASRIIFIYAANKGQVIPIPPPLNETLYIDLLSDLTRIFELEGQFIPSKPFLEAMFDWTYEHERDPPFSGTMLQSYSERRRVHILKLSMIMSASRSNDKRIELVDFERARVVLLNAEEHMLQSFSKVGDNPKAKVMPEIVRVLATREEVRFSELLEMFNHDVSKMDLIEILGSLEAMKKISRAKIEGEADFMIRYKMKGS